MQNYVTVKDKNTGEEHTYITGKAEEGASVHHVEGLNGGTGVAFDSKDEAAWAWALENKQFTKAGQNEHGATIYSQSDAKGKKSFSYNGSFEGSEDNVKYNANKIPKGAKVEGLIHTHSHGNDFSKHSSWDDRQMHYDEDAMSYWDEQDFYLVTPNMQLIVNRGTRIDDTGYQVDRDKSKNDVLATDLDSGVPHILLPNWRDGNGNKLKPNFIPPEVEKYLKKKK